MANLSHALTAIREQGERYYVYLLRRPSGDPFYVGKGRRDRIAMHERDARRDKNKTYRIRIVRDVLRAGLEVGYEIVGFFDAEADAFSEERRLIALYGRFDEGGLLANHTDGGEGAANPSAETISKRAKKLRAVMKDHAYKAAAVAALRSNEAARVANSRAAVARPETKAKMSERMRREWQDPAKMALRINATRAAQDLVWKARQAEGVARVQADPEFHARRNAGRFRPDVIQKLKRIAADPVRRAKQRETAKAQRAEAEVVRRRVLALAASRTEVSLPNHRSSVRVWRELEMAMTAGGAI